MPTPVTTARQCLTEETTRALNDAVTVARKRSHTQTTSLHAISGLLTMPSSVLREVCMSRATHNTPYSSRLQFRALELCVSVSLDRLPSTKSLTSDEDPPVSNSLMAAIKRSQATQRRNPEPYHMQQYNGNQTTSVLKVELKYFILSILDDPIVSRVFGEAGYRSTDIKLDVLHPPVTRFLRSRYQEYDPGPGPGPGRVRFGFPFGGFNETDENCRRVEEVLCRKNKKNPLLIGNYGGETLKIFTDSVNRGKLAFLPSGLSVVSIEKEISEILVDELGRIIEQSCLKSKSGMVLNLGDLKVLASDVFDGNDIVLKLSDLLKLHCEKIWFIGCVSSNETYMKLIRRFPTINKDWNLHLLPITSSSQGVYPKSSLMRSFVPFGGFFSSTSDFRVPMKPTLPRCHLCNEKYEQEVASFAKPESLIDNRCSEKLPSWLRNVEIEQDRRILPKVPKDNPDVLASRKWDEICQRIHQTPAFPKLSFHPVRPQNKAFTLTEDLTTSSPLRCATLDLGLGTTFASKNEESRPLFRVTKENPLLFTPRYGKDFKSLRESLSRKVCFQDEAVNAISEIVCAPTTTTTTNSVWIALLGPDKIGKKKVALTLAEVLSGSQDNFISVDFQGTHCFDDRFRGKTIVDYIVSEVAKRGSSVVFIENVEKAEFLDQTRLSDAMRTGKIRNSHGREITMKNVIVLIATMTSGSDDHQESIKYYEEKILGAKNRKLRIKLVENALSDIKKRRKDEVAEVRAVKAQRSFLDLNLPVDEVEVNDVTSEVWFDDILERVDGRVTFKVIDFDGIAKNVERKILLEFYRCFGPEMRLEIEDDVIIQILAALRWLGDGERIFDQWVQNVLGLSFVEARKKYVLDIPFVVKLVSCRDDSSAEEGIVEVQFPTGVEVI